MAYASLSDVKALNSARVYTASSQPATAQVGLFLDQTAAVIDAVLLDKGYNLPVPFTASSALLLLQEINALGAWAKVEMSTPASPVRDQAMVMWNTALDMLHTADTILDIPKNVDRASPRGPGVTHPEGITTVPFDPMFPQFDTQGAPIDTGAPFFTRSQQFHWTADLIRFT